VRDGAEQRPENDRAAGLLGGGESTLGRDPREIGLAELGQHGRRGLVGEHEQALDA